MKYGLIIVFLYCMSVLGLAEESVLPTHTIEIKGNKHFQTAQLYDVLGVQTKKFYLFWKEDNPRINDKLLPTLKETLISFYESEGFYDAKFKIKETNTSIEIEIKENKPVVVREINITSDFPIASLIGIKKSSIFKAKDFIEIKSKIIENLLNKGYCSYQLDTKAYVDLDKHEAALKYKLNKGGICTFGKPNITGLETIDKDVIMSRVRAKEGERFDPKKVKETYAEIYGLNSFDAVKVNVDRKFYNVVPVDIALHEVDAAYHFEGGVGYDTYIGPRIHLSLVKRNFYGNAQQTGIKFSWSKREQLAEGEYYKPALFFLFDYGIDFGTKFGYSNLEYRGFQEEKGYGRFYLEHNEGRLKLRSGLALENIDITAADNLRKNEELKQAVAEGTFLLFYPYLNIVYDARDDKLNPKYGYYLSGNVEYGIDYKPSASSYIKMYLEGRLIHTFDKLTLATVAKAGVVDEKTNTLPESKLFFAGGSFYNRAYGFNTIGVITSSTSDSIAGASSMLNVSFEADYPIWGNLYGAVFSDNTMLNEKKYDFSGDVISSAGVGVRYMTPIGPLKLDVGFNVHKPSQNGISFQIGQSF